MAVSIVAGLLSAVLGIGKSLQVRVHLAPFNYLAEVSIQARDRWLELHEVFLMYENWEVTQCNNY